jgi:hypothetical protein
MNTEHCIGARSVSYDADVPSPPDAGDIALTGAARRMGWLVLIAGIAVATGGAVLVATGQSPVGFFLEVGALIAVLGLLVLLGVLKARLELTARAFVVYRPLGFGRRVVALTAPIEVGSDYISVGKISVGCGRDRDVTVSREVLTALERALSVRGLPAAPAGL